MQRMESASAQSQITPKMIRQVALSRLPQSLPEIVLRQAWTEARFLIGKQLNFRKRQNKHAVRAYCEMGIKIFEGINARQAWSNWRTVPKNLSGRLPSRPIMAIDLCCGVGQSTQVLACYLPQGSTILGLEYNEEFVRTASKNKYVDLRGLKCDVSFNAQSVLDAFTDAEGRKIPAGSVDLVNSCGAVGHHFDEMATRKLAEEVTRVLARGGLALIDSGNAGTPTRVLIDIFEELGFETLGSAKSCFADPYTQVCFRKK